MTVLALVVVIIYILCVIKAPIWVGALFITSCIFDVIIHVRQALREEDEREKEERRKAAKQILEETKKEFENGKDL